MKGGNTQMEKQKILKNRRLELGLTMREVATALGVSEATISRYESGDIQNMGIDKLQALAEILHCSPVYLMGFDVPVCSSDLSSDEEHFLHLFRNLNLEGQHKLIERAEELRDLGYVKGENIKRA